MTTPVKPRSPHTDPSGQPSYARPPAWVHITRGPSRPSSQSQGRAPLLTSILDAKRLDALAACDKHIVSYDPQSYLIIFRLRGRNLLHVLKPLVCLLIWSILWGVLFSQFPQLRSSMLDVGDLTAPLLTPVSFLLVFRLGRAAVRFWDARSAAGRLVETSRTMSSTALVGCASCPEVADLFARYLCVFPLAVKEFLRGPERHSWTPELRRQKQRVEIGDLLLDSEIEEVVDGPMSDSNLTAPWTGPILVLNRLRQLAFLASKEVDADAAMRAMLYNQLNSQIDTLTGAWGAMERINATPLPYVYVAHLRTFLIIYLALGEMDSLARHGWPALPFLVFTSWALLGIESAAVECERPFRWQANHLTLGKVGIVVSKCVAQTVSDTGLGEPQSAPMLTSGEQAPTADGDPRDASAAVVCFGAHIHGSEQMHEQGEP
jgi:putative membrane protein